MYVVEEPLLLKIIPSLMFSILTISILYFLFNI